MYFTLISRFRCGWRFEEMGFPAIISASYCVESTKECFVNASREFEWLILFIGFWEAQRSRVLERLKLFKSLSNHWQKIQRTVKIKPSITVTMYYTWSAFNLNLYERIEFFHDHSSHKKYWKFLRNFFLLRATIEILDVLQ